MKNYKYQLDESSRKFRCPNCGKKRFVKYMNCETETYMPEKYGRCDREVNCGYHYSPYDDKNFKTDDWKQPVKPKPQKPVKFIPAELFQRTKGNYSSNNFVNYLLSLFDKKTVDELIKKYHIGTVKDGGCIFYQIDDNSNIRRGKIMYYGKDGHRDKKRFGSVHTKMCWKDYKPDYCYFGQHLLKKNNKPVAIVESEKTAMIASVYLSQLTWIATGSLGRLNAEHGKPLVGKNVILFPDLGAYDEWKKRADDISYFCNVSVSDLLEQKAPQKDRDNGYDLADYLTLFNVNDFSHSVYKSLESNCVSESRASNPKDENNAPFGLNRFTGEVFDKRGYPSSWDSVKVDPDTQGYLEATQAVLNDANQTNINEIINKRLL